MQGYNLRHKICNQKMERRVIKKRRENAVENNIGIKTENFKMNNIYIQIILKKILF